MQENGQDNAHKSRFSKHARLATTTPMQGTLAETAYVNERCVLFQVRVTKYGGNQLRHFKRAHTVIETHYGNLKPRDATRAEGQLEQKPMLFDATTDCSSL